MSATTFVTDRGVHVPGVTIDKMREFDRIASEELGPNLFQMMENAGRNLALTVIETIGDEWATTPIVVLAGTGGNGGGGICAARHLANRGADVTVVVSDADRLAGVPSVQVATYKATEGALATPDELSSLAPDIVVDAVIGSASGVCRAGKPEK